MEGTGQRCSRSRGKRLMPYRVQWEDPSAFPLGAFASAAVRLKKLVCVRMMIAPLAQLQGIGLQRSACAPHVLIARHVKGVSVVLEIPKCCRRARHDSAIQARASSIGAQKRPAFYSALTTQWPLRIGRVSNWRARCSIANCPIHIASIPWSCWIAKHRLHL